MRTDCRLEELGWFSLEKRRLRLMQINISKAKRMVPDFFRVSSNRWRSNGPKLKQCP